jgi:hypothetical protein
MIRSVLSGTRGSNLLAEAPSRAQPGSRKGQPDVRMRQETLRRLQHDRGDQP